MRMIHSVVIREKPPSKRPRKQSKSNTYGPLVMSLYSLFHCFISLKYLFREETVPHSFVTHHECYPCHLN